MISAVNYPHWPMVFMGCARLSRCLAADYRNAVDSMDTNLVVTKAQSRQTGRFRNNLLPIRKWLSSNLRQLVINHRP